MHPNTELIHIVVDLKNSYEMRLQPAGGTNGVEIVFLMDEISRINISCVELGRPSFVYQHESPLVGELSADIRQEGAWGFKKRAANIAICFVVPWQKRMASHQI